MNTTTTEAKPLPDNGACEFATVLPGIRTIARDHGYAIGLHGSMTRDMDLIAVPWVEQVSTPDVLAAAICQELGGYIIDPEFRGKPHGRVVWLIGFGYVPARIIDLSIMPATEYVEDDKP